MWGVAVTMNIYMDQDTCISVVLEEVRKLVKSQGPLSFVIAARSLSLSLFLLAFLSLAIKVTMKMDIDMDLDN